MWYICNAYLDPIPIASASAMQVLCFHKSPVDHHISSWFTSAFFVARLENALGFYGLALSCLSRDEPKDAGSKRQCPALCKNCFRVQEKICVRLAWCGLTLVTHLLCTCCFTCTSQVQTCTARPTPNGTSNWLWVPKMLRWYHNSHPHGTSNWLWVPKMLRW